MGGENEGAKDGKRGKVGRKKRKSNQKGKVIEESWGGMSPWRGMDGVGESR